jgi:hypothetical protein
MHTSTKLHDLLLDFRDDTGARNCAVASLDAGSRVDVGRPSTLTEEDLALGKPAGIDLMNPQSLSERFLFATASGYAVGAEFESEREARDAQSRFDALVGDIKTLVTDDE